MRIYNVSIPDSDVYCTHGASDKFLTVTNLMTIIKRISIQSIVISMTMIICQWKYYKLDVSSLANLCFIIWCDDHEQTSDGAAVILASVIIGALVGFITG